MAATRSDISNWLDTMYGNEGITHMVVKCDTFDWQDYPVYVGTNENFCIEDDVREAAHKGDRLMEVYSRNHTKEAQLAENRAFHYD